jgi:Rap1a immunity proteins
VLLSTTIGQNRGYTIKANIYGGKAEALADECKFGISRQSSSELRECESYINGLMDGQVWAGYCGKGFAKLPCIPLDVTTEQLARVVAKYGDDHPERLHEYAFEFVAEAIKAAYPCIE